VYALPGIDDGSLRADEQTRHRGNVPRVGAAAQTGGRAIRQWLGDLFAKDIRGDLDQHRARPSVARLREGAPQRVGHGSGERDLLGRFGDVLEVQKGAELRWHVDQAARIARGQHDKGD
jgi:hypothetical protein